MDESNSAFSGDGSEDEIDNVQEQEYVGDRNSNGKRDGIGKAVFSNGDQYEGDYRDGLRDGNGIYHFKNGARYDGEWKNGLKHGRGKFTYPDGSSYCGDWKLNQKHGFGKYLYANYDVYEGNWIKDVKHGIGTYKFNEADILIKSVWIEGQIKGPIEIIHSSFRYHGYWNKQNPVGEGVYTFSDKVMLPGHIDFYPNPDFIEENKPKTSNEVKNEESEKNEKLPRCLPEFVTHQIEPYNYSKLPQQPFPLPKTDSNVSICTGSSKSDVQIFQVQPPILISAVSFENGKEEEEE